MFVYLYIYGWSSHSVTVQLDVGGYKKKKLEICTPQQVFFSSVSIWQSTPVSGCISNQPKLQKYLLSKSNQLFVLMPRGKEGMLWAPCFERKQDERLGRENEEYIYIYINVQVVNLYVS